MKLPIRPRVQPGRASHPPRGAWVEIYPCNELLLL